MDWWTGQGPFLHDFLKDYLTLEADSQAIRAFEPMVVPGLLQTEAYMRRLYEQAVPADQVEALVDTRMKRKVLLDNKLGFRFRAVIEPPLCTASAVERTSLPGSWPACWKRARRRTSPSRCCR
ncbi:hypothetical protein SMICM17S_00823 [Streptomyces microflavus]